MYAMILLFMSSPSFLMFSPTVLLLFTLVLSVVVLALHHRLRGWAGTIFFSLIGLALSFPLINSPQNMWVFLIGLIVGYLTDTIGVYLHYWKYDTRSGYCWYVGIGWALLSLVIFHSITVNLALLVTLCIVAMIIVARHFRTEKNLLQRMSLLVLPKLIYIIVFPKLFLLSFAMGVIIEHLAVEHFHVWKYKSLSYPEIGIGYAEFMCAVAISTEILTGVHIYTHIALLSLIICAYISYQIWIKWHKHFSFISFSKVKKQLVKLSYAFS